MADRGERILRFHVTERTKNEGTQRFNVCWIKFVERLKNKIQRRDSAVNYILYRRYFLRVYTWNLRPNRASSAKTRSFWSVHRYKLLAMPIPRYRTMHIVACIVKLNRTSVFVVLNRENKERHTISRGQKSLVCIAPKCWCMRCIVVQVATCIGTLKAYAESNARRVLPSCQRWV